MNSFCILFNCIKQCIKKLKNFWTFRIILWTSPILPIIWISFIRFCDCQDISFPFFLKLYKIFSLFVFSVSFLYLFSVGTRSKFEYCFFIELYLLLTIILSSVTFKQLLSVNTNLFNFIYIQKETQKIFVLSFNFLFNILSVLPPLILVLILVTNTRSHNIQIAGIFGLVRWFST